MEANGLRDNDWVTIGGLIAACTLVLTASFIGVLAFAHGRVDGLPGRVPWYLIVGAAVFVATIVLLEGTGASGAEIIVHSLVIGVVGFVLVTLSVEGAVFTVKHPQAVLVSRLPLYFLAASLAATGIGYWGVKHWREFTAQGA